MRSILKILLICFAFAAPVAVQAETNPDRPIVLAQGGGKSLDEAVQQVRRQYPDGRIISAETKNNGKRDVHHIRVMVDGKVRTVTVNGPERG